MDKEAPRRRKPRRTRRKRAGRQGRWSRADKALKALIAGLFDEKEDKAAGSIRSYLEAILADKAPKEDLMKLIGNWEEHETRSARSMQTWTELSAIWTHLGKCEELVKLEGAKDAVKIDNYIKRYWDAKDRYLHGQLKRRDKYLGPGSAKHWTEDQGTPQGYEEIAQTDAAQVTPEAHPP